MIKQYLGIFALVTLGAIAGVLYKSTDSSEGSALAPVPGNLANVPAETHYTTISPKANTTVPSNSTDRVTALEAEIALLRQRIEQLESPQTENTATITATETFSDFTPQQIIANAGNAQAPIINGLIEAGMNPVTAEEIARQQSEAQLARLELRDTAIREGYMGTRQYREELRNLMDKEFSVRNEIDESVYDRYLYHTGQSNRVVVSSVMMGSAAENSGVKGGDQIVRYEDQRVYNFNDLRAATTRGERDELVDVTVIRDGNEVTMSISRGPLGINMNSISVDPET
jgi:membrane-associated protease RseP (regulator of RpoE activity)